MKLWRSFLEKKLNKVRRERRALCRALCVCLVRSVVSLVSGGTNSHRAPSLLSLSQRFQVDDWEEERGLEPSEVGTRSGCKECEQGWHPRGYGWHNQKPERYKMAESELCHPDFDGVFFP